MSSSVAHTAVPPVVRVTDLRLVGTPGPIRATATVRYGPALQATVVHGVKVFDSARGITIGGPQQQFTTHGQTRYSPIVTWDPELHAAIVEAVTLAYREALGEQVELFGEVRP